MVEHTRKLSVNEKFVIIDFYEINSTVFFSEVRYYPCSGFLPFDLIEWDKKMAK